MSFDKEYFQQIFGSIMSTNVAPIFTNIYVAMLEKEIQAKCKNEIHFLAIKVKFYERLLDRGFNKWKLTRLFNKVKFSDTCTLLPGTVETVGRRFRLLSSHGQHPQRKLSKS